MKTKKKKIIFLTVILSIVLYLAGVLSGLYANKIIEEKTQQEITFIKDYVDVLTSSIETIQIQESFSAGLDEEDACAFSELIYNDLESKLAYFWETFPSRLEEYEKYNDVSAAYLELKSTYTKLSLRTWVLASNNYKKCNTDLIPVLYFYSRDCPNCVEQGEILDTFKKEMAQDDKKVIVFTIDLDSGEQVVEVFEKYFSIDEVPAIIIEDHVFQGGLIDIEELGSIS